MDNARRLGEAISTDNLLFSDGRNTVCCLVYKISQDIRVSNYTCPSSTCFQNMALWAAAPKPKTSLGQYRLLSPNAGVHVSPIQLGGMSIGDKWSSIGMGSMDKESSFKLLDAYFDNGGNFIDTANS